MRFERMGATWQSARLLDGAMREWQGSAPDHSLLTVCNALCVVSGSMACLPRELPGADEEGQAVPRRGREAGRRALALCGPAADPAYRCMVQCNPGEVMIRLGELVPARCPCAAKGVGRNRVCLSPET